MLRGPSPERFSRFADMFSAIGAEPRLRIMRILLAAHPQGLVVNEIQEELGIPSSTLSHHLEKLKHEGLVSVRRERQFLWYAQGIDELFVRRVLHAQPGDFAGGACPSVEMTRPCGEATHGRMTR